MNSKNHISAKWVRLPDYNTVNAFLDNCSEKKNSNLLQIELLEWYNHILIVNDGINIVANMMIVLNAVQTVQRDIDQRLSDDANLSGQ